VVELLKSNYFLVLYAVALVLSLYKYKYYFESILKYFPIIIAYTLFSEILGLLIRDFEGFQIVFEEGYSYYNQLIFNIFDIIFFLYFFFVFRKVSDSSVAKKVINRCILVFVLVSLINPFLQGFKTVPQIGLIIYGSLILVFCTINYFIERKKGMKKDKRPNLLFWISIGLLLFYSFYPIIMTILVVDLELYLQLKIHEFLKVLITIMYGFFIVGFIRVKKRLVF